MRLVLIILMALLLTTADSACSKSKDCMDEPKTGWICPDVEELVCGCNGVTYSNACKAEAAGVRSWRNGECSP